MDAESARPERALALVLVVVPPGERLLDVAHQLGDVEQAPVEPFPLGRPPLQVGLVRAGIESLGELQKFLLAERPESQEPADQVVVGAHHFQACHRAEVQGGEVANNLHQFAGVFLPGKRVVALAASRLPAQVVLPLPVQFDSSRHSRHRALLAQAHSNLRIANNARAAKNTNFSAPNIRKKELRPLSCLPPVITPAASANWNLNNA